MILDLRLGCIEKKHIPQIGGKKHGDLQWKQNKNHLEQTKVMQVCIPETLDGNKPPFATIQSYHNFSQYSKQTFPINMTKKHWQQKETKSLISLLDANKKKTSYHFRCQNQLHKSRSIRHFSISLKCAMA